jgi:hypothetical protein
VLVEASRLPYRDVTKEETPGEMRKVNSPLFEIACVFVRFDHAAVASYTRIEGNLYSALRHAGSLSRCAREEGQGDDPFLKLVSAHAFRSRYQRIKNTNHSIMSGCGVSRT